MNNFQAFKCILETHLTIVSYTCLYTPGARIWQKKPVTVNSSALGSNRHALFCHKMWWINTFNCSKFVYVIKENKVDGYSA